MLAYFRDFFLDDLGQVRTNDEQVQNALEWLQQFPASRLNRLLSAVLEASQTAEGVPRITTSALTTLFLRSGQITNFSLPPLYFMASQAQYDPNRSLADKDDPENILSAMSGKSKGDREVEHAALKRANKDRVNLLQALRLCPGLRSLSLIGQSRMQDDNLKSLLAELPLLEEVILKGCTAIGDGSVLALAKCSGARQNLKILNLNYAAVTVNGLRSLFARCKSLEVLKLANMNGLVRAMNISSFNMLNACLCRPMNQSSTYSSPTRIWQKIGQSNLFKVCEVLSYAVQKSETMLFEPGCLSVQSWII
jgi:hypothetical protein